MWQSNSMGTVSFIFVLKCSCNLIFKIKIYQKIVCNFFFNHEKAWILKLWFFPCSRPSENLLVYKSKVPANGWNIENSTLFTLEGIVSTIRNLNNNVTTTKYYVRSESDHHSDHNSVTPTSPHWNIVNRVVTKWFGTFFDSG